MNAAGQLEVTGDPDSDTASFWVSGLASPWRTWGQSAQRWLEAHRSGEPEQRQACLNTVFGELFRLSGEAPAVAVVQGLRGGYRMDEVPTGVIGLTSGVDVQANRLIYVIRGWGTSATSWLIRAGEVWGETDQPEPWDQLAQLRELEFGGKTIRAMFVDSGYRPDGAYAFARRFPGRVWPTKGHDTQSKPLHMTRIETAPTGKSQRQGTSLVHLDSGHWKAYVHGRIAWPQDQPGAWHLPVDATDDYCQQLIAEQRLVKPTGEVRWIKTARENHYLDCEALAAAAASMFNVHLIKPAELTTTPPATAAPPTPRPNPFAPWSSPSGKNWTTGWRR
jgi:phage terminase large subunit GpA-like protein